MILFIVFFLILCLYSLFSYILTEPNLILSSHPLYWNFQKYLWNSFYHDESFITASYIFLIIAVFLCYVWALSILKKKNKEFTFSFKSVYVWAYAGLITPLVLSYNALSHDIFNYAFNARMVLVWGANPHVKTALDFIHIDDWVRFMHNIHTSAPYGYGWTAVSLIPSFLGMGKLLPTLILFKVLTVVSIFFLYYAVQHLSKTLNKRNLTLYELAVLFLNPLLLIEIVSNYHNDLWMMAPAVLAVSMLLRLLQPAGIKKTTSKKLLLFFVAFGLLLFSISIKIVTILLVPLFVFGFLLLFLVQNYANLIKIRFRVPIPTSIVSSLLLRVTSWIEKYIPTFIALLLFIPLFTDRSQQFLPWYLVWILVWVPFINNKTIRNTILIFSLSSLLRYVPWLSNSFEYSDEVILQQKLITWLIPIVYLFTNIKDARNNYKKIGRI